MFIVYPQGHQSTEDELTGEPKSENCFCSYEMRMMREFHRHQPECLRSERLIFVKDIALAVQTVVYLRLTADTYK
jgi:hypothetical protein